MIDQPLILPCGYTISNRICKSAMTEGLADVHDDATVEHERLYQTWSQGGAGLLITGNIMIDRRYLERAGNVVVENDAGLFQLRRWTDAVHKGGSRLWAQISHPGRQCPRLVNTQPLAPSAQQLHLAGLFAKPRAVTEADIQDIVQRFAKTASIVQSAGMDGVQIHSAHGYLLSQFLSPRTNKRQDAWGGSLENRARLLLQVIAAVRDRVGPKFPVGLKLNSADFVKGGFTLEECLQVVALLNGANIDLLEISGGTYEQTEFLKAIPAQEIRDSTRQREALFLEYAKAIKQEARMPLMVTGGFRTRSGMDAALESGHIDLVGVARPFCVTPDFPKRMLDGSLDGLPITESKLVLGTGWWGPNSSSSAMRGLNAFAQVGWYYRQIERLGAGKALQLNTSPLGALLTYVGNDTRRALRRKWA